MTCSFIFQGLRTCNNILHVSPLWCHLIPLPRPRAIHPARCLPRPLVPPPRLRSSTLPKQSSNLQVFLQVFAVLRLKISNTRSHFILWSIFTWNITHLSRLFIRKEKLQILPTAAKTPLRWFFAKVVFGSTTAFYDITEGCSQNSLKTGWKINFYYYYIIMIIYLFVFIYFFWAGASRVVKRHWQQGFSIRLKGWEQLRPEGL